MELLLFFAFLVFVAVAAGVVINLFRQRVGREETDATDTPASLTHHGFFAGGAGGAGHGATGHTDDPGKDAGGDSGGWFDGGGGGWGDGGGFGGGDGGGGGGS